MSKKRKIIKDYGYLVEYQDMNGNVHKGMLSFLNQQFAFQNHCPATVECLDNDLKPILDNENKSVFISLKLSELTIKDYIKTNVSI